MFLSNANFLCMHILINSSNLFNVAVSGFIIRKYLSRLHKLHSLVPGLYMDPLPNIDHSRLYVPPLDLMFHICSLSIVFFFSVFCLIKACFMPPALFFQTKHKILACLYKEFIYIVTKVSHRKKK